MDIQFEKEICLNFFKKACQERVIYELGNEKRKNFYKKIAHTSELYLNKKHIIRSSNKPICMKEIGNFFEGKECYFMCNNKEFDGIWHLSECIIEKIWSNGTPYIIVNKNCTKMYLEEEYNFSVHKSYFLLVN